jgi:hypothetical protein
MKRDRQLITNISVRFLTSEIDLLQLYKLIRTNIWNTITKNMMHFVTLSLYDKYQRRTSWKCSSHDSMTCHIDKSLVFIVITAIWNWPFSHFHLLLTTKFLQPMKHYFHTIKLLTSLFSRFWHLYVSLRKINYGPYLRHVCLVNSQFVYVTTILPTAGSKRNYC